MNENTEIVLESCVESLEEAIQAFRNGATQLELCSRLEVDGLTPSYDLYVAIKNHLDIPIKVMIRNRPGDFVYNKKDLNQMLSSMREFIKKGVDHFVLGALDKHNHLDMNAIRLLCNAAFPIPITIHKCIDEVIDITTAIQELKTISNVKFILTSGGEKTAMLGIEQLKKMIQLSHPEIDIIAAGKITTTNLEEHIKLFPTSYFHGRRIV